MIVLWIIGIAAVVGIITIIADLGYTSSHKPYGVYEKYVKRGLDAFLATGALIVLSLVLLITAFLVRIKLGSPVLFTQDRPGRDGKIFKLYKFRTMLPPKDGVIDPSQDAARLTPFGKKLRSTSLDELPELINMIKGDMAVVGSRPLLVQYLSRYNSHQARRHEVHPGFTGLAQVHGRNAISWEERITGECGVAAIRTFLEAFENGISGIPVNSHFQQRTEKTVSLPVGIMFIQNKE